MPGFLFLWTSLFVVSASLSYEGNATLLACYEIPPVCPPSGVSHFYFSTYSKCESDSLSSVLASAFGLDECALHSRKDWHLYRAARWEAGIMTGSDFYKWG